MQEKGTLVGMHASDSGYTRYYNEWEGHHDEMLPFVDQSGFSHIVGHSSRPIIDTLSSAIGHGMLTRFPKLKVLPVENGTSWVRSLIDAMGHAYKMAPTAFEEDPVEVFKRNVFVHPFHEDDVAGLADLIGVDNVLFGSDYPHPEGLADPISYVDEIAHMGADKVAKVMGGNLARLMGVENTKVV
jgi:predicted TIM-barrel fold metal-dependent hydrolase